mmetsp:Transcript_680/g.591  ORF Transcript_680/g.591 Transcript_680/m.591 type:complete len:82 (+) Transcript_680:44-289(+)
MSALKKFVYPLFSPAFYRGGLKSIENTFRQDFRNDSIRPLYFFVGFNIALGYLIKYSVLFGPRAEFKQKIVNKAVAEHIHH